MKFKEIFDQAFQTDNSELLNEGKTYDLGKGYSVRFDYDHSGCNNRDKDHLHWYRDGNELGSINRDQTGHDGTKNFNIPRFAFDKTIQKFPNFPLPDNRHITESNNNEDFITINLMG